MSEIPQGTVMPGGELSGDGPMIRARGLHKHYPTAAEPLHVLQGLDLEVEAGEIVTIVGASGSGKSTLLHLLGALDRPTGGTVEVAGSELDRLGDDALAEFRNRLVGFIFQFHYLLPEFTARENVALPALMAGQEMEAALERAGELLGLVGLAERSEHRPAQLSGGEQQRVAVARALTNRPAVLLADEPSGNLDLASSEALHDLLWELNAHDGQTLILVTHNLELADRSERRLELREGLLHGPQP